MNRSGRRRGGNQFTDICMCAELTDVPMTGEFSSCVIEPTRPMTGIGVPRSVYNESLGPYHVLCVGQLHSLCPQEEAKSGQEKGQLGGI
jgi:hypothetical protein